MLGWLFVAVLGIIWVVFLLPYGRWWSSPTTSVEEFERNMDLLAETNGRSPGRWVLIPRKGARFVGAKGRSRMRVRRRRRQILAFLIEITLLALVIGLFPPLHRMLVVPAVLACILVVYVLALMRIRVVEVERARATRRRAAARGATDQGTPADSTVTLPSQTVAEGDARVLAESGLRIIQDDLMITEDDVHVVVHRSDEIDLEQVRAASGAR